MDDVLQLVDEGQVKGMTYCLSDIHGEILRWQDSFLVTKERFKMKHRNTTHIIISAKRLEEPP